MGDVHESNMNADARSAKKQGRGVVSESAKDY